MKTVYKMWLFIEGNKECWDAGSEILNLFEDNNKPLVSGLISEKASKEEVATFKRMKRIMK